MFFIASTLIGRLSIVMFLVATGSCSSGSDSLVVLIDPAWVILNHAA
jgi:hypothetical protein